MSKLVSLVQDIHEKHDPGCACGVCDVTGNSYGVSVYPLELSCISDEPLFHVNGITAGEAMDLARCACEDEGWKILPVKCYTATVQVVVFAESAGSACDWFSETLRGASDLVDWRYLRPGEHSAADSYGLCSPTAIDIPSDYSEGMAFEVDHEAG